MSLIMSSPLIEVRGLTRHFNAGASPFGGLLGRHNAVVRAVESVDFQIARGETFALVGESGCGKSTLARCVVGLLAPTAGSVAFSGRRVQMIFQNPYASLNPRWRIFDIIAEPARAYRLVDAVNVERREREYPKAFQTMSNTGFNRAGTSAVALSTMRSGKAM